MRNITPTLSSALLACCATRSAIWSAPSDAGEEGVCPVPFEKVLTATKDAASKMGFVVRDERSQGPDRHPVLSFNSARYVRRSLETRASDGSVGVLIPSRMDTREAVANSAITEGLTGYAAGRIKSRLEREEAALDPD